MTMLLQSFLFQVINERVSWNEEKEKLIKDKDSAKEKVHV